MQAGVDGYTIADGIAVKVPSELTMPLLEDLLDDIVWVADEEISEAIVLAARAREAGGRGSGRSRRRGAARRQGRAAPAWRSAMLSGGNIDATHADLGHAPRPHRSRAAISSSARTLPDRPGELIKLLSLVADERGNVDRRRAPPRGGRRLRKRDGDRPDTCDARRGTLPAAARRDDRARLHSRTTQLGDVSLSRSVGTKRFRPASRSRRRAAQDVHRRRLP